MKFHVVTAAVLLTWTTRAAAQCTMRHTSNLSCVADIVCYGDLRLTEYRPPLCPNIEQTHVRLNLRGPSVPNNTSCNSYMGRVLWLRAAKNGWTELPSNVLQCTKKLQYLHASANQISKLQENTLSNMTELRFVDLSGNKISSIPKKYFSNNNKLERLILARNVISQISNGTFAAQSLLENLDLSQNKLMILFPNSFAGLKRLKVLKLNDNKLLFLNGAFKNLNALQHLYLQQNKLLNVDIKEIPQFSQLQTLDMTNNSLSGIDPKVLSQNPPVMARLRTQDSSKRGSSLTRTSKILLAKNNIVNLENGSFNASSSKIFTRSTPNDVVEVQESEKEAVPTEIDLSSNMIEKIEYNAFTGICLLISLDLSKNKLTFFAVNTTNLHKLEKLHLQNNDLKAIDAKTFRYLVSLKVLSVGANKVKVLANNSYWSPGGLEVLDVSHNRLQELTGASLGPQHHLRELTASNNNLSIVLLNGDKELSGIRVLSLRCNGIQNMTLVQLRLLELQTLDLSENNITEIPREAFNEITGLRRLDLSKNKIETFESGSFSKLSRLVSLDLADNHLTVVDYGSFAGLARLQSLDLSRNRLDAFDSRVLYDLHALEEIRLDDNNLNYVETSVWTGRSGSVLITLGGNRLSCSWLEGRLEDARRGWSVARLSARVRRGAVSLAGIDCDSNVVPAASSAFDERLLVVNQNILQAILRQTQELKKALKMIPYARALPNKTSN